VVGVELFNVIDQGAGHGDELPPQPAVRRTHMTAAPPTIKLDWPGLFDCYFYPCSWNVPVYPITSIELQELCYLCSDYNLFLLKNTTENNELQSQN
jgi:hypothetical protein